ncbi:hypothetical protein M3J09_004348 [Ascochyta lentis]
MVRTLASCCRRVYNRVTDAIATSGSIGIAFLTHGSNNPMSLTVELLLGGGSSASSILTAPLLDGKLLRLAT